MRPARTPRTTTTLEFCEGVRRLTGIDLTQYKRPQMERRIRSFADRRGDRRRCPAYLSAARGRPRRSSSEFLDRVTINVSQLWRNPEQWDAAGADDPPRARRAPARSARGAPAARTAPRPTRWPRSAAEVAPRRRRRDPRHRHRPAHGRPRPRGPLQRRRRPHARRPAQLERWFDRDGRRLAGQARAAAADAVRRPATCCATGVPPGRVRPGAVPQRRHLLHRAGARRACTQRLVERAAPRRLPDGRLERARRRRPQALGLEPPHPFIYRKASDGHLRVPGHVPGREPRAPADAEPGRHPHRGVAGRPRHHRRDLPHRALPEGDERRRWASRGWRRSRTRWRTSSRRCAAAPAALERASRSTCCSECLDALEGARRRRSSATATSSSTRPR